jgi:thioredoxin-like negative regulator of GroEL
VAVTRGIRARLLERIDLQELGAAPGPGLVVQFTHPLCADCQALSRRLSIEGRSVVLVDVSRRPDLARKYGVAVVPLAYAVGVDGRIGARLRG